MVNTKRAVRQFVDPLRLEAFDKDVTGTEEFSDAESYVIVKKIRDLGIHKVHIGAAATWFDFEPAVEQEFGSHFPEEDWVERGRERRHVAVARLKHALRPARDQNFGRAEQ